MARYIGIDFGFKKGSTSFPEQLFDSEVLASSIDAILNTERTERVMRPDFGADILRFVFSNNDDLLTALIIDETRRALSQFEPRILVRRVTAVRDDNQVIVSIDWSDLYSQNRQVTEIVRDIPQVA